MRHFSFSGLQVLSWYIQKTLLIWRLESSISWNKRNFFRVGFLGKSLWNFGCKCRKVAQVVLYITIFFNLLSTFIQNQRTFSQDLPSKGQKIMNSFSLCVFLILLIMGFEKLAVDLSILWTSENIWRKNLIFFLLFKVLRNQ